jgi:hypothetical protein
VLWAQLLEAPDEMADLRGAHPDVAARLDRARRGLDVLGFRE